MWMERNSFLCPYIVVARRATGSIMPHLWDPILMELLSPGANRQAGRQAVWQSHHDRHSASKTWLPWLAKQTANEAKAAATDTVCRRTIVTDDVWVGGAAAKM